jgi:ABC-2 type transport system permease protein
MTAVATAPVMGLGQRLRDDIGAMYIIWFRDVLRFWRQKARVAASLGQPLMFLLIFGSGFSAALGGGIRGQLGGTSYMRFLFPGIVAMPVLFTSVFSAMSVVWDREFGVLKEVLVAPISRTSLTLGKALGGSTVAMAQGAIMLLLAPVVGVSLNALQLVQLMALLFLAAFALSSMALVLAARLHSMEAFQMLMNFIVMPMFFLSGAFFPLHGLPMWMDVLTRLNPVAYAVDPARRIVLGASKAPGISIGGHNLSTVEDALILSALALIMIIAAVRAFEAQD